MNWKGLISFWALLLILLAAALGGPGCANIIAPEGGAKDSLPPAVTRVTPDDSTLNFDGKRISFVFDEFIQVDNFQQNVLISPIPRVPPAERHNLNTLSLTLKDTLDPNTTYTINFGNAVKDVNEGNVLKDFYYVFSTGSTIDSLKFSGNVVLAETGKVDSALIVILHSQGDDSAVVNGKPRYMAKLDGKGHFTFRNLPPGTFYLYALQDEARSYRYLDKKKLFAFSDSPVVIRQNTPGRTLYAYIASKPVTAPATPSGGQGGRRGTDRRIKLTTTVGPENMQDLLTPFSFKFDVPLRNFDSSKVRFFTDTLFTPIQGYDWTIDSTRKKVKLNYTWTENTLYHLILEKDFATDTAGLQMLRNDTISFHTRKAIEYGTLSIRFRNLDLSKKPVLQFIQSDQVVHSFPLTSAVFTQALFQSGDFDLRILNDTNGNGIWDAGEFFGKHKQPEIATPIRRSIKVRENWGNEYEIAL